MQQTCNLSNYEMNEITRFEGRFAASVFAGFPLSVLLNCDVHLAWATGNACGSYVTCLKLDSIRSSALSRD